MGASAFHEFARELFASVGPLEIKRMFGGAGGYIDGVMFLLLADDIIHLKTDETLRTELRSAGSGPFVWRPESGPRKGENVEMSYWRLPEAALDDPDEAAAWGRKALAVARARALVKRPRRAKR